MSKRKKKRIHIHPKFVYIFLSIVCFVMVVLSFKFSDSFVEMKTTLGNIITPMQKGINSVGQFISDKMDYMRSKEDLLEENEELKKKIDELSYDNKILAGENSNLENYRELYQLDKMYPDYPKVAATVVSRDGNNWFHLFTIDKGTADGVDVDMNVIAGKGLVGIVSEAGEHYAKVRAIIDDKSNVSAMFEKTGETCMVKGNMESIFNGYIDVEMINNTAKISEGDEVVTSHVSDKYLQGLSVGYIKDIEDDPLTLTKTAHLIPVVSFDQLETVLIITTLKDSTEVKDMSNYD
ncbi:MAG: rod shape-determining protein MreC [Eubacterium sp.]|nr:rod shape-determining protein MreC [Eubacterium sp.]